MKYFLIILFLWSTPAAAADYYWSFLTGNDANPGTQAQPFQSLSKLNQMVNAGGPSDHYWLKRGDTYPGQLSISKNGAPGNPIIIGSYGVAGTLPVISGFANLASWTNTSGNIWRNTYSISGRLNVVLIGGQMCDRGRYPNLDQFDLGYLHFESHNQAISITDNDPPTPLQNWVGAEISIRNVRWMQTTKQITAQSGGTYTYNGNLADMANEVRDYFGYYIQNDIRTLDQQNEWYWDGSGLNVYSTSNPSTLGVRVATVDTLVKLESSSNITFQNIRFEGANSVLFYAHYGSGVTFAANEAFFCGGTAVKFDGSVNGATDYNIVRNIAYRGIDMSPDCAQGRAFANQVINVGMHYTLAGGNNLATQGIFVSGANILCLSNRVDSTGYNGIAATGSAWTVKYNYVSRFGLRWDDGAGIYTSGTGTGRIFKNNIVLYGPGNRYGTNNPDNDNDNSMNAVGLDDLSEHVLIDSNVVGEVSQECAGLHNSHDVDVFNNLFYNAGQQAFGALHDQLFYNNPIYNVRIVNNTFVSNSIRPSVNPQVGNQFNAFINIRTRRDSLDAFNFGSMRGNRFWKPYQEQNFFRIAWRYVPPNSDCTGCSHDDSTNRYRHEMALTVEQMQKLGKDTGSVNGFIEPAATYNFAGSEIYTNGAFSSNANDIRNRNPSTTNISWIASGIQGGSVRVTNTTGLDSNTTSILFYRETSTPTLLANHTYRIRFKIQAAADGVPFRLTVFSNTTNGPSGIPVNDVSWAYQYVTTKERFYTPSVDMPVSYLEMKTDSSRLCPWFIVDSMSIREVSGLQYADASMYSKLVINPSGETTYFLNDGSWLDDRGNPLPRAAPVPPHYGIVVFKNRNVFPYKGKISPVTQ